VARISRERALLLNIGLIWGYLLVIGAGASALRAGVMLSLAIIANLIQRPTAAASTVAAAAFIIIGTRPLALLDPGLQLSFAGVLAILYLRPPLLASLPERWRARSKLRMALDALIVGIAAFLITAPIAAHHFGIVAPVSILAGIPAVPLMSLALIGAMAALVADLFLPGLALNLAAGADLALVLLNRLTEFAAGLPYGHADLAHFSWSSLLLPLLVGTTIFRLARRAPPRLQRLLASGAAIAALILWPLLAPKGHAGLEIHFLDVGQGDAIALRTPRNRWLVVDAGPLSGDFDAGERRVLPFLRDRGARRIEALVLTHPDLDHIGGAAALLRAMPVHSVFEPGLAVGKQSYLDFLRELDAEVTEWRAARTGRTVELDGVQLEFLWPDAQAVDASEDANQISAVLKIAYGDFTLLLTGDADAEVERVLVERHGEALAAHVLKLGHHGSNTSTSEELLRTVQPRLAVVSAGRRNRYGHPAPLVVARVERHGIELARTDLEGSISIRVAPGGSHWSREEW
jgi:competence protein ComEC